MLGPEVKEDLVRRERGRERRRERKEEKKRGRQQ
jgi:hypothetical protein